jgi:eukaryotic-like serine/threonine-protein kinase
VNQHRDDPTHPPPQSEPTPDGASSGAEELSPTVFGGGSSSAGGRRLDGTFTDVERAVSVEPLFRSGELIADRYRVARFLARGGMSEVYAVQDLELNEAIALKTLGPRFADAVAQARFKREISLARKIGHPNVCRIFDLGRHFSPRTGEVDFLTMELLQGQTVSQYLRQHGAMAAAEALPLVVQMAAGLEAAHAAGVIHRDFKSSNVFLVPGKEGGSLRAVVTDFGVARPLDDDSEGEAMTLAGQIIGTPAYMAPEQVQGLEVTTAADVYAFGVVLYQMVTGQLPFRGNSPFTTAVKRLTERPESPRAIAPHLSPLWEEVILRCLERDPAARFESAGLAVAALTGGAKSSAMPSSGRSWLWVGGLAVAAAIGGGAALWWQRPQPPALGATELRRSVAVLGFKNLSGDPDTAWISTALAEMIGAELAAGGQLRLLPGESVARLLADLDLVAAETLSAETLQRVHRHSGTDAVVVGSSLTTGPPGARQLRLDLRVQDTTTGETAEPVVVNGSEADLVALVGESGSLLRRRLGIGAASAAEETATQAALPRPEAARLYIEGLAKLRNNDALGARADLEQAIAAQPDYPLAHSALARVWTALGYDARAAEAARRGFEHSQSLPLSDRLWIEGEHYQASRDWTRAIETFRTLWSRFPDQLEYGLRLAETETIAGRGQDALATLAVLRQLPAPASDDPRLDLAEYGAAEGISDFKRAREAAVRAREKGLKAGQRLLAAEARLRESWALRNLGENEAATTAAAEARQLFAAAGRRAGEALAANQLAVLKRDQGDLDGARQLDEESLLVFREVGDQRRVVWAVNNLGKGLELRGDLLTARLRFEEALALSREIDDRVGIARQLNNLAGVLAALGDLLTARRHYEEALPLSRAAADRRVWADILRGRGDCLLAAGELAAARQDYEGSLGLAREIAHRRYEAFALAGLGNVALATDDLALARSRHQEALAIRESLGERVTTATSQLALAEVALAQARTAEAATLARTAAEAFAAEGLGDREAIARAFLARSLGSGSTTAEEVRTAAERVATLAATSQNPRVAIQAALVQAAVAPPEAAKSAAAMARHRAEESGLVGLRLEAALVAARLELASGGEPARQKIAQIAAEAGALGYARLAREAAAAGD